MPKIKLFEETAAKAWSTLIEVGPIHRIAPDPIYLVSSKHIEVLTGLKIPFERLDNPSKEKKDASNS